MAYQDDETGAGRTGMWRAVCGNGSDVRGVPRRATARTTRLTLRSVPVDRRR